MKKFLFITAALWVAFTFIWAPAVASPGGVVAISVSPLTISFGEVLPGSTVIGSTLNIENTGSADITVRANITADASNFYTNYLYLDGTKVENWEVNIVIGGQVTVTPKLMGVPSNLLPGSYSCTVIFWAEAIP